MNRKNYIESIKETFTELNWELCNLYIKGNNLFGCVNKTISIRPNLNNTRISLSYSKIEAKGIYAASDCDSNDVYIICKELSKEMLNKEFNDNTMFVPCYVDSSTTVKVKTYCISKDILSEYKVTNNLTKAIRNVEKRYIDKVKAVDSFDIDFNMDYNYSKMLDFTVVPVNININSERKISLEFTSFYNDLVSFTY